MVLEQKGNKTIDEMFDFLNKNKKTSLYNFFYKKSVTEITTINQYPKTRVTNKMGKDAIQRLRGTIIVPLFRGDLERIRRNKGFATILDGGIVYIDKIVNGNMINIEGFQRVGDISDERISA
jgi:hypothetical protein